MVPAYYKLTVYWTRLGKDHRDSLLKRFGLPIFISVNRETPCEIRAEDMEALHKAQDMGYIQIRKMESNYERREEKRADSKA